MTGRALAISLALLSIISLPQYLDPSPIIAAPYVPQQVVDLVIIEIVEELVSMDVSVDGQPSITVHWSATLSTTLGRLVESVDVHMTPDHPSEIGVGLSIYDFTLTPAEPTLKGTANISAAPGTSASARPVLIMDATAIAQPRGNSAGVTADSLEVVILPFFSAEAYFSETAVTIKVGERRSFVLHIENRGNSAGDFSVSVGNSQEMADKGLEVSISEPTITIGEGSSRKVDIIIKVKDGAKVGGHNLQVKVTPVEAMSGNIEGSALIALDVREAYMSAVQDILANPLYLLGTFALAVIVLGLAVFLGFRLRAHLAWRRTLKRIRSSGHVMEEGPKGL
ncbi:MAG: hypothetical protein MUC62_03520 [Candidatus Thermoplasmatota archaeon]|jgi:hypothetical protein|nr:hypothetical protein [Candidatus Thermoplasmatota archaeon]